MSLLRLAKFRIYFRSRSPPEQILEAKFGIPLPAEASLRLIPRRVVYACAQYQSLRLERICISVDPEERVEAAKKSVLA